MSTEGSIRHKLNKKLKTAVGMSNNSIKKGHKKAPSALDDNELRHRENDARRNSKSSMRGKQFRGGQEGSKVELNRKGNFKRHDDAKRSSKSSMRDKQFCGGHQGSSEVEVNTKGNFRPVNSDDRKRKRIYADQDMSWEGTSNHNADVRSRKALSKKGRDRLNNDFIKGKNSNSSQRSIRVSSRTKDATVRTTSPSHKLKGSEKSIRVSDGKWRTKAKEVDKVESGGGDGTLKKHTKSKSDSIKRLDQSQKKHINVSLSRSGKRVSDKKSLDSEITDDKPKKKKRVIRIDPHDISNKRMDDGIVINENTKEKREDLEKNVEMSKNAQFRAIQPSPSILSFVEDNLLGRRRLIELRRAGYNINLSAPLDNIPSSENSERARIEENIFRNKMTFFAAAKIAPSFPPPDLPEVAFAGRSNVGKSSLLNALTRQWGVARTSDKPGLTQTINFFELGSKLCLVDLPGYGFAYAKEEVKDAWEDLVKEYVSTRVGLKQVCLLIDTKWGLKPRDHELIDLMERSQTKYQIVLTKTDMIFPIDVARRAMQIEESLKAKKSIVQPLMMVSSKSGAGIGSLRTVLAKIARFARLKA